MMKPYIILAFVGCSVIQLQAQTPTNKFPDNGNAGIGTISPGTSALAIERSNNDGGITNSPSLSIKNTSTTDPAGNGYNLAWANFMAGDGAVLGQVGANYGVGWGAPWNIGSGFYIAARTDHPIIFTTGAASTEKMRITNAGNVGIGIANPEAKLTVNGDNPIFKVVNSGGRTIGNTIGHEFALDGHTQSGVGGIYLVNTSGASGVHDYKINLWNGSTGAVERLRIQGSTGNVGIGTAAPSTKLEVQVPTGYGLNSIPLVLSKLQQTNDAGLMFRFAGGSAGATVKGQIGMAKTGTGVPTIFTNEIAEYIGIRSETGFHLGTNGDNIRMTVTTAGNVGIGTVSPTNKLDIVDGMPGIMAKNFYETASIEKNGDAKLGIYTSSNSFVGGAALAFGNTGTLNANNLFPGFELQYVPASEVANTYMRFNFLQRNTSGEVGAHLADILNVYGDGRVAIAGNVGVGTISPTQKLDVNGNIKATGLILPTGAATGKVLTSDANGNATWQMATGSSSGWGFSGNTVEADKKIGTIDNYSVSIITGNTERIKVLADGRVAIGAPVSIPSTDAKLAVYGGIYSTKVKVTQNGWADYVFDAGYRLRPLSEVEQYIQQHHHLPEVPSAAEVEKGGLDLGDNQATLLKKIEELTLYVIEQNKMAKEQAKKLEHQQREIDALKKQLQQSK